VPQFEEVEPDVKSALRAEQQAEFKRKAYEAMRARYQVVLPKLTVKEVPSVNLPTAKEAP
jgi:hypothetical protein